MAEPPTLTVPTPSTAALLDRAIAYTTVSLHLVTPAALRRPTPCAAWTLADLLTHMNDSFQALYEAAVLGAIPPPAPARKVSADPGQVPPGPLQHTVPTSMTAPTGTVTPGPGNSWAVPATAHPPYGVHTPDAPFPGGAFPGEPPGEWAGRPSGTWGAGGLRGAACATLGAWAGAVRSAVVSVGGLPLAAEVVAGVGAVEVALHGWDVAQACGRPRPIPAALAGDLLELAALFVTPADRPARFAPPRAVPPDASAEARLLACLGRDPGAS